MKENVDESNAIVPFQYEQEDPLQDAEVPNFNIMQILNDVQNEEVVAMSQIAKTTKTGEMAKQQIVKRHHQTAQ